MARILNLLIVILEVVSLSKTFKSRGLKKNFVFYTQLSNSMLGEKRAERVIRESGM